MLVSEELHRAGERALPVPAGEITPELDGFGTVHAYFVDVEDLDDPLPPLAAPRWRGRLGATFRAAGKGMPYLLGLKRSQRTLVRRTVPDR